MACGCSKKGMRNTTPRAGLARPVVGPRSASGGLAAATPPTTLRAQSAQAPQQERSFSGLNAERRKVEKVRRDAIRRALNKH